ncbi:MAG: DUF3854 domain-containing protein [Thermodesulfobacteriota bacterium]
MSPLDITKLLQTAQSLAPEGRQDLEGSGIDLAAAKAAGVVSVPLSDVSRVLGACDYGWAAPNVVSLTAFPYLSLNGDGEIVHWRFKVLPPIETKKGTTKYLQPKDSMNHVYCPPGVNPQGKDTLYLGEGEKKALCLTLHGYPSIGLSGVYGWKRDGKAIPDFDLINWKKRDVVIVFDADIAVNAQVEQAETDLAEELLSRRARVFIVRLPYTPGCAKGVDDFLVRHGKQAFEKLPRKPFKSGKRRKLAPKPDGEKFYLCGHGYFIERDRLCLETYGKKGEPESTVLANFSARISEEITKDDGLRTSKEFHLTGSLDTGEFISAQIPAKEFDSLHWVKRDLGAAASVAPGRSLGAHLVNAIQAHSQGFKKRTVYAHTGWRKINGVWRYLHGGGAIGPGDPVEVDLGENLQLYRLPAPGGVEAAQASLRFLDIAPWDITVPLISCVYLAPFADLLKMDFLLWLYGPTGGFKSSLAALALAHYGNFTRKTLPGSWFSTANYLEQLTFILKDSLVVIDDFIPSANHKEAHAMAEKAGRLIYQVGNRSSRGRLAPDLTARPNRFPRGFIISTGEMLLPGQKQSATARYLGLEFDPPEKSRINKVLLAAAQKEQALYPQAMAAYLEHLAPQLDDTLLEIQELWEGYRTAFQTSGHSRIPENQAWLAVGFEYFLRFLTHKGAVTDEVAERMLQRAWKIIMALGEKHSLVIEGERPSLKFIAILKQLFYQGRIYVESIIIAGSPPPKLREVLGWMGAASVEPAKNAALVGWADESTLYLMPDVAVSMVREAIRRSDDYLSLGKNELFRALARERFIEPGKKESTRTKWIQDSNKRVIYMPLEKLACEMEDNSERIERPPNGCPFGKGAD